MSDKHSCQNPVCQMEHTIAVQSARIAELEREMDLYRKGIPSVSSLYAQLTEAQRERDDLIAWKKNASLVNEELNEQLAQSEAARGRACEALGYVECEIAAAYTPELERREFGKSYL